MKEDLEDYSIRVGKGVKWQMVTHRGDGKSIITGFSVDNLDTKLPDQAENEFESLFIGVRRVLERFESCCLDEEKERLDVCQALAEEIHKNLSKKFRK